MRIYITKQHLSSPSRFRSVDGLHDLIFSLKKEYGIAFNEEDLTLLVLSACRCNEFEVIKKVQGRRFTIDTQALRKWVEEKLNQNTIVLRLDNPAILQLLIFSIEITYSMLSGTSRATATQKGFRERRRTFEGIVVDQFVGKLGEVAIKQFLKEHFGVRIELDWDISPNIEQHRNDIKNAKKLVSVKTSSNLAGIWAEADRGYDYGITVKCSVSNHPLLQFFIETCGFKSLLNFVESKLEDELFRAYLDNIRKKVYGSSGCGDVKNNIVCFVCGYFETSQENLIQEGVELEYLGHVRETRHFVKLSDLRYKPKDWEKFLNDNGLLDRVSQR